MNTSPLIRITLLLLLVGLTGCSYTIMKLYGMKKVKPIDDKTVLRYAERYHVPTSDLYLVDTSYLTYLFSFDTLLFEKEINNHYQPLQALYYDSAGQLQSYHINCYAGGFPNLNWDRDSIMTTFPPKDQTPVDTLFPLDKHLSFLRPLDSTAEFVVEDFDYVVIVHWNRWMGRQSKRFIQTLQENRALASEKAVKIVYANTDNLFTVE